jgi:glycosyltransferase
VSKNIWIIHETASTPDVGYAGRWFYLSKYLSEMGHKIHLVSSSYSHVYRSPLEFNGDFLVQNINDGFNFIWLKVPCYKDSFDKRRILNWFIFNNKLRLLPSIINDKPDFIVSSSPSPISSLGATKLAKRFNAKFIFDVRDIWPLSLMQIGGYSKFNPFIIFLSFVEKNAYKKSYKTTTPLENAILHMKKKGLSANKFKCIANGCDFEELDNPSPLPEEIINLVPKDKFVIGYCGTIGEANGVEYLVKAAKLLQYNKNICFVIVGNGKNKKNLQNIANNLKNIIFIDTIAKRSVQNILKLFDICYFSLRNKKIFDFGISPNKIPEYLYASRPVLYSYSGYGNDMIKFNFGFKIEAENENLLADKILEISEMPRDVLIKMGKNAKRYALKNYSYKELAKCFIECIT